MHSLRTTLMAILALGAIAPGAVAQLTGTVCYSSKGNTKNVGMQTYQTASLCRKQCADMKTAVFGVTKGSTCFCGNKMPSDSDKVSADQCDVPCQGYPQEICGGNEAWTFGYTGVVVEDDEEEEPTTSSSSGPSSTGTDGAAVQTTVINGAVTVTADPSPSNQPSGGTNVAPIAAGVVVGVVALIALGVGGFLYVRRNRRRQAEEEYRAAVAAKEFTASIRKPASDSRLDPVMLQHRRLSDGSIADNEDYSRRILKVTNPDA